MNGSVFSFVVFLCVTSHYCQGLQCTRENELSNCGGCPPERTCQNREIQFSCLQSVDCTKSCVCQQGFIRDAFHNCISDKVCDSCGPNEFWSCGSACDNSCDTIHKQNRTNCPVQNIVCNDKCYCKDGFARNGKGKCVPIDHCCKS